MGAQAEDQGDLGLRLVVAHLAEEGEVVAEVPPILQSLSPRPGCCCQEEHSLLRQTQSR